MWYHLAVKNKRKVKSKREIQVTYCTNLQITNTGFANVKRIEMFLLIKILLFVI